MTSTKKQKRNVAVLALVSILLFIGYNIYKAYSVETQWFYESCDGGYRIYAYTQALNDKTTDIVIPSEYNGKAVVAIADKLFYKSNHIKKVTIPDTVKEIGASVFKECKNLVAVEGGNNVTVIGGECFKDCKSLVTVNLADGITELRGESFMGCSALKSIDLPANITEIKGYMFEGCSSLERVEIPVGVTRIAAHAFYGCSSLTEVFVPDTVTEIGSSAFRQCKSLEKIEVPEGVSINERAFKESPTRILKKQISDKLFEDIKNEIDSMTSLETVYALCDKSKGQDEYLIENNTIALVNDIRFEEVMGDEYELRKFADSQELIEYLNKAKEQKVDTVKWFLYSNIASEKLGYTYFVTCEQHIDVVIEAQFDFIELNKSAIINKPETYEVVPNKMNVFKSEE